jgi:hypothetical protein
MIYTGREEGVCIGILYFSYHNATEPGAGAAACVLDKLGRQTRAAQRRAKAAVSMAY